MDHVPAYRQLPAGRSIWTAGMRQVGSTIRSMYKNYSRSLGLFFLAVVFAESATNAFTVVSVIYLVRLFPHFRLANAVHCSDDVYFPRSANERKG
jgi:hypothetical protein